MELSFQRFILFRYLQELFIDYQFIKIPIYLNTKNIKSHFCAISTNINAIKDFGIDEDFVFNMYDFVGGRFSMWGSVGLSISISVGYENFEMFLNFIGFSKSIIIRYGSSKRLSLILLLRSKFIQTKLPNFIPQFVFN